MRNLSLTVSQLNEYVRRTLASDPMLRSVCLSGEISNFKRHSSGHWYFTLKDEEAAINCAMFRQSAMTVRFRPENGQRVRMLGSVGLYAKTGSYQFYADSMEPDGVGDLYLQFEALKRKLASEGLFDPALKQPLPMLPRGVGIVTSRTGAVVHDIARVSWRRFPGIPLYLCPVRVQGDGAAAEIAQGIHLLDTLPQVDVIIVGRGGGSMEDLWAFNEERTARAIAACRKPVVSAVGHETDVTIADFAADVRAATPSAAAELVVPLKEELADGLALAVQNMDKCLLQSIAQKRLALNRLQNRMLAASPAQRRERLRAQTVQLRVRLDTAMQAACGRARLSLEKTAPMLDVRLNAALQMHRSRLDRAQLRLNAAGPMEMLRRGYAIVRDEQGVVRSASALRPGGRVALQLADGSAEATINAVNSQS